MLESSSKTLPSILHRKISDNILADIRSGELGLGDQLPSLTELEEKYKASLTTIRQSLATLERRGIIRREHGRGTFVSLQSGRIGDSKKLRTVGLVFEQTNAPEDIPAQNEIVIAFKEVCRKYGSRLLYTEMDGSAQINAKSLLETFEQTSLDGICLFLHEPLRKIEKTKALQREFPSAVLFCPGLVQENIGMDLIDVDTQVGIRHLLRYMFSLNHRRIAYVGSHIEACLAGTFVDARLLAYTTELENMGIGFDRDLTVEFPYGKDASDEIGRSILELVRREDPVTAIFAANDWMARHVINFLWKARVRVPEDVSVAGFDDISFSKQLIPPLTTVAFPFTQAAEAALDRMKKHLAEPGRQTQKVTIPTELVIRETVGPRAKNL